MLSSEFLIECPLIVYSVIIAELAIIGTIKAPPILKNVYFPWMALPIPFLILSLMFGLTYEVTHSHSIIAYNFSFGFLLTMCLILPFNAYATFEIVRYSLRVP